MEINASGDAGQTESSQLLAAATVFGLPTPPFFANGLSSQSSSPVKSNPGPRRASGIPRIKHQKLPPAKSVIYGSSCRNHKLKNTSQPTLSQFKSPWVPAPGKSTTSFNANQNFPKSKSTKIRPDSVPGIYDNGLVNIHGENISNLSSTSAASYPVNRNKNRIMKSSSSRSKNSLDKRGKGRSSTSSYTLKSKDSLIDVTAFLTTKREEIMRLWEHYLSEGNQPELLITFETANRLAAEASNEVQHLRKSIQTLHAKETSLSEGDCQLLDQLRQRVLTKIQEFEIVNSKVENEVIAATEQNKASEIIPNSDSPSKSKIHSSAVLGKSPRASKTNRSTQKYEDDDEIFFIKEKSANFVDPSLSDPSTDSYLDNDFKFPIQNDKLGQSNMSIAPVPVATQSRSNITATTAPSTIDLSKLARLYNEEYEMPPVSSRKINIIKGSKNKNVRFQKGSRKNDDTEVKTLREQLSNLLKQLATNENSKQNQQDSTDDVDSSSDYNDESVYKTKVLQLQRKLIDAEGDMVELKDNLQRVESESNFQVRLLKSSFENRLDNLENFPEYLQITENRLKDTLESKLELEKVVKKQDHEISKLKAMNLKLKEEMDKDGKEGKEMQSSKNYSQLKISELEHLNQSLSRDVNLKNEEIVKMSQLLKFQSTTSFVPTSFSNAQLNQKESTEVAQQLMRRNKKLELKIEELRDRLAKSNKNVHILQVTKEKMQFRLCQRQEELLLELEESRTKNRQLQSQIHYIKTTYHELFPMELFQMPHNHSHKQRKLKKKASNDEQSLRARGSNSQLKSSKVSIGISSKRGVEAPILPTKIWSTGQGRGDNLEEYTTDDFTEDDKYIQTKNGKPVSKTVSDLDDPSES